VVPFIQVSPRFPSRTVGLPAKRFGRRRVFNDTERRQPNWAAKEAAEAAAREAERKAREEAQARQLAAVVKRLLCK
jgi:hypothetical protein